MKKCPNCDQLFDNDNVFCINDGTTLIATIETQQKVASFATFNDSPTQIVPYPPMSAPPNSSSKWLFLIIGAMTATIVALAIGYFAPRNKMDENARNENVLTTNQSVARTENIAVQNSNTAIVSNSSLANISPGGTWTGNLFYPKGEAQGEAYSAQVDLTDEGNGQISGQVIWTCTANPKRAEKIGTSETEIARGNFDAATRTLSLKSYEKENPNKLASRFRLTLTQDNNHLNGFVFGRRGTPWNFNLRRL
ncbi:hypothetical protein BH10ACI1_BH10ACI1_30630 [soil metagenome]